MGRYRSPMDEFDEIMKSEDGRRTASFMKDKLSPVFERISEDAKYYGIDADEQLKTFGMKMYEYADEKDNTHKELIEERLETRPYPKSNQEMIPEHRGDKTGFQDIPQEKGRLSDPIERHTADKGFDRNYNVNPQFRSYDDRARPRVEQTKTPAKITNEDMLAEKLFGSDKPKRRF